MLCVATVIGLLAPDCVATVIGLLAPDVLVQVPVGVPPLRRQVARGVLAAEDGRGSP